MLCVLVSGCSRFSPSARGKRAEEAFLNLTPLKRCVFGDAETVGGPGDVAVIS